MAGWLKEFLQHSLICLSSFYLVLNLPMRWFKLISFSLLEMTISYSLSDWLRSLRSTFHLLPLDNSSQIKLWFFILIFWNIFVMFLIRYLEYYNIFTILLVISFCYIKWSIFFQFLSHVQKSYFLYIYFFIYNYLLYITSVSMFFNLHTDLFFL